MPSIRQPAPQPNNQQTLISPHSLKPSPALPLPGACSSVAMDDAALEALIGEYCREAGVRNLKKHLDKLYRKVGVAWRGVA